MSASKYDNAFKQNVLLEGIDKQVAKTKREEYKKSIEKVIDDNGIVETIMVNGCYYDFIDYCKNVPVLDCAMRLNESKYRKAKKVRDKISELVLSGKAIFITLTFTDNTFAKTSVITRRRYVARYLKANSKNYVANIDFGAIKGREHYHALVDNDIDFTKWHKYGAIKVERVKTSESDLSRVALYVSKLTNHALKVGENAPRLIYSRSTC